MTSPTPPEALDALYAAAVKGMHQPDAEFCAATIRVHIATLEARLAQYRDLEAMYLQQGLNMAAMMKRAEAAEARLAEAGRDAAELRAAALAYFNGWCQDEAAEDGPDFTGCTQEQHEAAKRLGAALKDKP